VLEVRKAKWPKGISFAPAHLSEKMKALEKQLRGSKKTVTHVTQGAVVSREWRSCTTPGGVK